MIEPLLTIITVCFNAAKTIESTLESVSLRPKNVEYIVIDGCSRDGTLEILQNSSCCIDTLISEPDRGIFDAMNKGALLARGSFLMFLNADDSFVPGALNTLVDHLQVNRGTDVLYADWFGVDSYGNERLRISNHNFKGSHRLCHQAMVARKSVFPIPAFDPKFKLCADFDLILKWAQQNRNFDRLPIALVRFSEAGASSKQLRRSARESILVAMRRASFPWALLFSFRMIAFYLRAVLISPFNK